MRNLYYGRTITVVNHEDVLVELTLGFRNYHKGHLYVPPVAKGVNESLQHLLITLVGGHKKIAVKYEREFMSPGSPEVYIQGTLYLVDKMKGAPPAEAVEIIEDGVTALNVTSYMRWHLVNQSSKSSVIRMLNGNP